MVNNNQPWTMATPELVPIRVAPACNILYASSFVLIPPDALIPISSSPMTELINSISSTVAPSPEKPVEILTKKKLSAMG